MMAVYKHISVMNKIAKNQSVIEYRVMHWRKYTKRWVCMTVNGLRWAGEQRYRLFQMGFIEYLVYAYVLQMYDGTRSNENKQQY